MPPESSTNKGEHLSPNVFPGDDLERLIPEKVRSILADLKKTPIEHVKWFYGKLQDDVYQGDILESVLVCSLNQDGIVEREGPAIVVSHTCDCQPDQSEFVLVAPIFSLDELAADDKFPQKEVDDFKRDLIANHLKEQIYLPAIGKLRDSWLDFSQMFSIASSYFHSDAFKASRQRIAGLSAKGQYFFLMRLTFYLGRPDPKDSTRE
jgi:hypothetical protein